MTLSVKEYKTRVGETLAAHTPSPLERALDEGVVLKDPQPAPVMIAPLQARAALGFPSLELPEDQSQALCIVCNEQTKPLERHSIGDEKICEACWQTSQRKSREPWWLPLAKFLVR